MTRARDLAAFVSNADGDIKFDTDTLFIDSSANRVGIGTTTPDGILDITGSGNTDVYINTGNDSGDNSRIFFGDTADTDVGYLAYDHGTNAMIFGVNAGNRMRIDSSGRVGVNTAPDGWSSLTGIDVGQSAGFHGHASDEAAYVSNNLYFDGSWKAKNTDESQLILLTSTSGSNHIAFYANASASADANVTLDEHLRIDSDGLKFNGDTAAANALDDYEEGTWTPNDASGAGLTLSSVSGKYVKIGRMVYVSGAFTYPSTSNASAAKVGGLPFTTGTLGGAFTMYVAGSAHGSYVFRNTPNTTQFLVTEGDDNDATATNANLSNASLQLTGFYHV